MFDAGMNDLSAFLLYTTSPVFNDFTNTPQIALLKLESLK